MLTPALHQIVTYDEIPRLLFRIVGVYPDGSVAITTCNQRGNVDIISRDGTPRPWNLVVLAKNLAECSLKPTTHTIAGRSTHGFALGDVVEGPSEATKRLVLMTVLDDEENTHLFAECDENGNAVLARRGDATTTPVFACSDLTRLTIVTR